MFHSTPIFIGLRYLRGRSGDRFSRFVSYMSTLGITIGVMSLVVVLSVMNGFEFKLKSRILGVLPQAVVAQADGQTMLSEQAPEFIRQLSQTKEPVPIVRSEAMIQSASQLSAGYLIGIQPDRHDPISAYFIEGDVMSLVPKQYQLFIGHSLARSLNVTLGHKVRLLVTSASQYTPLGRVPSQRNFVVTGIFNTGSDVDEQLMITHLDDAGRLLRLNDQTISGWRLFFDDPFIVGSLSQKTLEKGWEWHDWREQRGELFQAVRMEKNIMSLMLSLIVGVAAFNIISALIMVVMEKQSEVAILKTQGMSDRQIIAIFMVQGASSGVIGSLLGGALGVGLAYYLNSILNLIGVDTFSSGMEGLPVMISPIQVLIVVVLAIGLSLLATLFPSYRASSIKPAEALRYE